MFESSVIPNGSKMGVPEVRYWRGFESSVIPNGGKTRRLCPCRAVELESSVIP